jgi:hypothetical protein
MKKNSVAAHDSAVLHKQKKRRKLIKNKIEMIRTYLVMQKKTKCLMKKLRIKTKEI